MKSQALEHMNAVALAMEHEQAQALAQALPQALHWHHRIRMKIGRPRDVQADRPIAAIYSDCAEHRANLILRRGQGW